MKILLVEDSVIERYEVGRYLTEWGLDYGNPGLGSAVAIEYRGYIESRIG